MAAPTMEELLRFTVENSGSDLHVSSGVPPMLRIHGDVETLEMPALSKDDVNGLIKSICNEEQMKAFTESGDLDMSYQLGEMARFRVNLFQQVRGPGIVCRVIPTKILSLEELGAPEIFKSLARQPRGLVLVTGPTGSGKSTTLAAMINEINITEKAHILTVEDPVEFVHNPRVSLVNQREVGAHTKTFASSLRAALREDPDIILVGEMRDPETIGLALTAAETGHLVFGTLHTTSAAKTCDRIIDVFPAGEKEMVRTMLAESVRAVIAQTLLKKQDGGRVAAHEIMIATSPIKNLIRENKVPQIYSILQTSSKLGMITLDQTLRNLVDSNVIALEEAYTKAERKADFLPKGSAPAGGKVEDTGLD